MNPKSAPKLSVHAETRKPGRISERIDKRKDTFRRGRLKPARRRFITAPVLGPRALSTFSYYDIWLRISFPEGRSLHSRSLQPPLAPQETRLLEPWVECQTPMSPSDAQRPKGDPVRLLRASRQKFQRQTLQGLKMSQLQQKFLPYMERGARLRGTRTAKRPCRAPQGSGSGSLCAGFLQASAARFRFH